jgi:hypothetical protein
VRFRPFPTLPRERALHPRDAAPLKITLHSLDYDASLLPAFFCQAPQLKSGIVWLKEAGSATGLSQRKPECREIKDPRLKSETWGTRLFSAANEFTAAAHYFLAASTF